MTTKVFENSSPKLPNEGISYPKFRYFCFITKFIAIRQIWGCWFQTWQYFFKIVAQKHSNKTSLVPNLGIFVVFQNFAIREIWGCWFQIRKYFSSKHCPKIPKEGIFWCKIPKKGIFDSKYRHFCFFTKFYNLRYSRVLISDMTILISV